MRETLGYVVHEPKLHSAVRVAKAEHRRHGRLHGFAIVLRKGSLRPEFAGGLLLAHPIVPQKGALCFGGDIFFLDERNIFAARDREKQPKTKSRVGCAGVRQNTFGNRAPVSKRSTMNHPRQRYRTSWSVKLRTNPLSNSPPIQWCRSSLARNLDLYRSRSQLSGYLTELLTQARERSVTRGIGRTRLEHLIERCLLCLRKRKWHRHVDRINTAQIHRPHTFRVHPHINLCRPSSIGARKQIHWSVA